MRQTSRHAVKLAILKISPCRFVGSLEFGPGSWGIISDQVLGLLRAQGLAATRIAQGGYRHSNYVLLSLVFFGFSVISI